MKGRVRSGADLLVRKSRGLARYGAVHLLASRIPLYVVNEFPRSGGSWVGLLLSSALDVPFLTHRFPGLSPSVTHGHFLNPWGMKNVVAVWRDGRDVMVSWYHYCLFFNEGHNAPLVRRTRRDLPFDDYDNVRKNLPTFMEYAFTGQGPPGFSWAQFARRWHGHGEAVHVRYEDLQRNTPEELRRVVAALTGEDPGPERAGEIAEKFSFSRRSDRRPGDENRGSYMRKGVVGDWRANFTREACEVFDNHAGEELLLLEYEHDRRWVSIKR